MPAAALHQIFEAYCNKKSLTKDQMRFLQDGTRIQDNQTPEEVRNLSRSLSSPTLRPQLAAGAGLGFAGGCPLCGRASRPHGVRGWAGARGHRRHTVARGHTTLAVLSPTSLPLSLTSQLDMEDGDCIEAMMLQARRAGKRTHSRDSQTDSLPSAVACFSIPRLAASEARP